MKKRLSIQTVLWSIALLIGLQGCSGQNLSGSQLFSQAESVIPLKTLKDIVPSIRTNTLWQVQTNSASENSKIHPYLTRNSIIIAGGTRISAWDKSSGKSIWISQIEETISGGVNGGNGVIFIGTDRGNALALNERTGKIVWIKHLTAEILSISVAKNGRTVFRTIDGKLHGLSTQTGDIVWQQQQLTPVLSLYGASTPVLVGPYVIAGFDNGKLAAYELQKGTPVWEATLTLPRGDNELDRMVDVDGKLKALGSAMFASSFHGRISGVDLKTGNVHWTKKHSSYTGADANAKGIYTADEAGNIWRLEPLTGNPMWKMDDLVRRSPTVPTLINGNLLVIGDKKGNLHFINAQNGQFVSRIKGDSAGYSIAPRVEDNRIVY
ncbi:MAG: outer membrane protein assembly factor BamB, partial [Cocleimonas sp.]|nr:outer membrane protein assembly factor BamB [Cocleimonas sp.]